MLSRVFNGIMVQNNPIEVACTLSPYTTCI
jgi:hypothetical protein